MDNPIYYLQIYDLLKQKEIGSYINYINGTLDDFEEIEQIKKENKVIMKNHLIFIKNINDIRYTLVYSKSNIFRKKKDLTDNLIDILDYQGVHKMQDSYGYLTDIGKKYMIFSINQFIKKIKSNNLNSPNKQTIKFFDNFFSSKPSVPQQKINENVQTNTRKIFNFLTGIFTVDSLKKVRTFLAWVIVIFSLINTLNNFIQIIKEKNNY